MKKNQDCHPNLCTSMIHACLEESRVVTEAAECAMTCQLVVSTLRHDDASWDLGHPEPWHQRQLDRRHSAAIQGVVVVHAATPCSVLTVFSGCRLWWPNGSRGRICVTRSTTSSLASPYVVIWSEESFSFALCLCDRSDAPFSCSCSPRSVAAPNWTALFTIRAFSPILINTHARYRPLCLSRLLWPVRLFPFYFHDKLRVCF
jgi:hypothetical protein